MKTKNKKEYIEAWHSHIDTLWTLCLTPNEELSKEVHATIEKLKEQVKKVANDKWQGSGRLKIADTDKQS